MRVFGIDPGSTVTAFGVVSIERGRYRLIDWGAVRTSSEEEMGSRLLRIHRGLRDALERNAPDAAALETNFRHKSSESALRLGQARGVALLACAEAGLAPFEYNNTTIKRTVGAYGRADKEAVARMVRMLLGPEVPDEGADITDALAIAITHCNFARNGLITR